MTEEEWGLCGDPLKVLRNLRGRIGDRKLRLFAVACCRQIEYLLDERCKRALDTAERFADGLASPKELEAGRSEAYDAFYEFDDGRGEESAADAVESACCSEDLEEYVHHAAWVTLNLAGVGVPRPLIKATRRLAKQTLVRLLRDITGNPFRMIAIDPTWIVWNEASVLKMAQHVYESRQFGLLPILCDALEEAGCREEQIIKHCRQEAAHVRGCWILDLLLGKEKKE